MAVVVIVSWVLLKLYLIKKNHVLRLVVIVCIVRVLGGEETNSHSVLVIPEDVYGNKIYIVKCVGQVAGAASDFQKSKYRHSALC